MATPGGLVDKQELIDAQLDTAHLGRVVNSKDASGAPINTSTNRTGGVNKTLDALEAEYQGDIDNFVQVSDQLIIDKTAEFDSAITDFETEATQTITDANVAFDAQREGFEATFSSQFAYNRIGNISTYVGDTLLEADKLNAYQYPDNSGEWYGPIQGQTFPITIPANPSTDNGWALVNNQPKYKGLWPDTGGEAFKGDTFQTQVGGTPTGQYFEALQDTLVDPVNDDVNWREVVSVDSFSQYTDIVYKASGGSSAVENMVSGFALNPLSRDVGSILKTGSMTWRYENSTGPVTIENFRAFNTVCTIDFESPSDADDTASIQRAIDSLPSSPQGKSVDLLPREYTTSDSIKIPAGRRIVLRGQGLALGSHTTTIYCTNPNVDIIDASTTLTDAFSMQGLYIKGQGVGSGSGNGLLLGKEATPAFDSRIFNCWFGQIPNAGIFCLDARGYHISQCGFEGAEFGIVFDNSITLNNNTNTDNVIENNRFFRLAQAGIKILKGRNNTIVGNHFDRVAYFEEGTNSDDVAAIFIQINDTTTEPRGTMIASNTFGGTTGPNVNDIVIKGATSDNFGPNAISIIGNTTDKPIRQFIYAEDATYLSVKSNVIVDSASGTATDPTSPAVGTWEFEGAAITLRGSCSNCDFTGNSNFLKSPLPDKQANYGLDIGGSCSLITTKANSFVGKISPVVDNGTNNIVEGYYDIDTDSASVSGTTSKTDLRSSVIPKQDNRKNKGIKILAAGLSTGANTKTLRVEWGNDTISIPPFSTPDDWAIECDIIYSSATSQLISIRAFVGNAISHTNYVSVSENLEASDVTLKITGQLSDAGESIVQRMWRVESCY